MKALSRAVVALGVAATMLASCSTPKKVTYLEGAEYLSADALTHAQKMADPVIMAGDLLNIQVTGVNMAAMAPFNRGTYVDADGRIGKVSNNTTSNQMQSLDVSTDYYLVNAAGNIDFPIVGEVHVAGLSKQAVATEIADAIYPRYVTEKPSVDVRLMNFRVTVAGAVKTPGVYQSKNERMTFLEAIAMAGDLDIKADRENILLYRVNADGTREVHRLDLHDRDLLLSPYYTLQQNDFIYVEPNKSLKQSAWQMNPAVTATITVVGGLSSLASLIIGIVNLAK